MAETTAEEQAVMVFCCSSRFHQSIVLPATDTHGPLRVTYAVAGSSTKDSPTMFFAGGMFGLRYQALNVHHLAEKMGVRVVYIDRPGLGGSTPVDLEIRVDVWLETVVALMQHLELRHIALGSHSAGTIYLLNTLLRLPHVLSPTKPYVVMAAPWVHPGNSGVSTTAMIKLIPESAFQHWSSITKFTVKHIIPVSGYSSGISSSILSTFSTPQKKIDSLAFEHLVNDAHGMSTTFREAVTAVQLKCYAEEDTTGGNSEALLCVKTSHRDKWGGAQDLPQYLKKLVENIKRSGSPRWKIQSFFAESDMLIGEGGRKYFTDCWQSSGISEVMDFEPKICPETNHDTVVEPQFEMYRTAFAEMTK